MKTVCSTILMLGFLLLFTNSNQAQSTHAQLNRILIGSIDSIHSRILNEQRKIWVYVPNSASQDANSTQHFPVVYLLDGDLHFFSVVGMIQQLSIVNGNKVLPEMIVVGIPNTDRTRDLTTSHVLWDPEYDSSFVVTSGGGEKFTSFIETELMPYIDSLYPTSSYRILIGHSFGGLLVINTLINHTKIFNAYITIDPSMSWDNEKLLNQTKTVLSKKDFIGTTLYLAAANTVGSKLDTFTVITDTSLSTRHIRSILKLSSYLKSSPKNNLKFNWKYYKDDDHTSVPLIAEYDALRYIFDYYNFRLYYNDYADVNKALIDKMENHYQNVSTQIGYKVRPPQDMVNLLGYWAIYLKRFVEAIYLFKLNVNNYPTSSDVYDSLGDCYAAKGDKLNAIDSYKKALSIKEVTETRKKLKKLQVE
jgi:uncharacterized protein